MYAEPVLRHHIDNNLGYCIILKEVCRTIDHLQKPRNRLSWLWPINTDPGNAKKDRMISIISPLLLFSPLAQPQAITKKMDKAESPVQDPRD